MELLWWYWIVFGICLIMLELIIPSFTILWFGFGALAVSFFVLIFLSMPDYVQVFIWSILSILFTIMWFKYLRPKKDRTRAGLSKEGIVGATGMIIMGTDTNYGDGKVKFHVPFLGADEWRCISDTPLKVGDNVRVTDIIGQKLNVVKI